MAAGALRADSKLSPTLIIVIIAIIDQKAHKSLTRKILMAWSKSKQRGRVKANRCWKSNLNSVTLATSLCSALCELLHLQLQNSIRQDHDHHHCTIDGNAVEIRIMKKSTLEILGQAICSNYLFSKLCSTCNCTTQSDKITIIIFAL